MLKALPRYVTKPRTSVNYENVKIGGIRFDILRGSRRFFFRPRLMTIQTMPVAWCWPPSKAMSTILARTSLRWYSVAITIRY